MSFNWTQLIPGVGHEYAHVATAGLVSVALIGTAVRGRAKLGAGDVATVPAGKFSVRGICELIVEFITGISDTVIGHGGRHYVPLFCAVFTWVLINNLVGIIPGMTPATENLNTTLGMGLCMFIFYVYQGIKETGWGFIKHLFGPIWQIAPVMFLIELISHMVRPVSLGLRLANVLMGDHTVLGIFLDLVPLGAPIVFYILGAIVCFIQAFVFTLLSMVYVALAIAQEEH